MTAPASPNDPRTPAANRPPLVVRSQPWAFAVAIVVLALIGAATATYCALQQAGALAAVCAAVLFVLAGVGRHVALHWNDRVEIHADHVVEHRRNRSRRIETDDLTRMSLRLARVGHGFDPRQDIAATLSVRGGTALTLNGRISELLPALHSVGDAMARRMTERMDAGESLAFPDATRFPLLAVVGVAVALVLVFGAVLAKLTGTAGIPPVPLLQVVMVLGLVTRSAWHLVRQWLRARSSRGLAVCARGIRPLSEAENRSIAAGGYREAAVPAGDWIPWSDVVRDNLDGYGLTIDMASRDEPIALAGSGENLFPLHRLMGVWIDRSRREKATRVRVDVDSHEPDEAVDDGASARSRRARSGD